MHPSISIRKSVNGKNLIYEETRSHSIFMKPDNTKMRDYDPRVRTVKERDNQPMQAKSELKKIIPVV